MKSLLYRNLCFGMKYFFSFCFLYHKVTVKLRDGHFQSRSKAWRPGKSRDEIRGVIVQYLFCIFPLKTLERLIYVTHNRPLFSREQTGFKSGKPTVAKVIFIIQDVEDSFGAKEKDGAILQLFMIQYGTAA